jgi:hypothetical protein
MKDLCFRMAPATEVSVSTPVGNSVKDPDESGYRMDRV